MEPETTETTESREPTKALKEAYEWAVKTPSDINEHLELLHSLALECERVTEFGTRWAIGSTLAFLAAQPKTFITWDINPKAIVSERMISLVANAGRTNFQPRVGDTLKIPVIEQTDLLFIDSLHTAKQLWQELLRHADPVADTVRKYLVFHDTVTFGTKGEDGSEPGLRRAIHDFQKNHAFPLWRAIEDRQNNNGLIVLRHVRWDK